MIAKEKIGEAANEYADEKYEGVDFYKGKFDFMAGASWILDNLWHPTSEEPKFGRGRLLVLINGSVSILNVGFVLDQLRNLHNVYGIESWCYLEDILPIQKGGKE